ncbi:MAG: DUF1343 domain-containing protein [Candidatus Adiutrix sp.]|jgi:uncharacterized protein YbbC (DUF1343 family)|nr:DUF1343 domain-containing protein [Candidatus Adiutrix sp.]
MKRGAAKPTRTGLERFLAREGFSYKKARLGLLAGPASIGPGYCHALDLLDAALPGAVVALFGPQHGWAGEKQDNMVESPHGRDRQGRPIHSLYGETRRPTPAMLAGLDALLVDMTDVGTRVYTFAHTLSHCLEEAGPLGLEVIVLDRPNPLGGQDMEGHLLSGDCLSFVGLHPLPMRHGLTLGELARFINRRLPRPAPLTVVPCENWRRSQYFPETGLPWVSPSPNLPTFESAWVYPGQVIWEGLNVSEGRGTTRPFNLVGAPFINSRALAARLGQLALPGLAYRPVSFQPTFNKWAGEICQGLELFPLDKSFRPYLTGLSLLQLLLELHPESLKLKEPPYEYEYRRRPLDLILGRSDVYDRLAAGLPAADLAREWGPDLAAFQSEVFQFLLYD